MYCPTCRAEYREGFTTCATCEVDLVLVMPDADPFSSPEKMAEVLADQEVVALMVGNHVNLQEAQRVLAEARIASMIAGEDAEELETAVHARFYLMIAQAEVATAQKVFSQRWEEGLEREGVMLTDKLQEDAEIESESGDDDLPCPACGTPVLENESECSECGLFVGVAE
ncbi:MAG: hypothetical protein R3C68_06185 [Myxococcota bacterium]